MTRGRIKDAVKWFARGMGQVLTVGGGRPVRRPGSHKGTWEALGRDFQMIGNDIRSATVRYGVAPKKER